MIVKILLIYLFLNLNNQNNIILQLEFDHSFDSIFEHEINIFPTIGVSKINIDYKITSDVDIKFVSPIPDKKGKNTFGWYFNENDAGENLIQVHLTKPEIAYIVPNKDYTPPTIEWSVETIANMIESDVYLPDEIGNIPSNTKEAYVLGDYIDISSLGVDDELESKGIGVHRLFLKEEEHPTELFKMVAANPNEVAIANVHYYEDVKEARDYAIQNKIPLFFIEKDDISQNTIEMLSEGLYPYNMILFDEHKKISQQVIDRLEDYGDVYHKDDFRVNIEDSCGVSEECVFNHKGICNAGLWIVTGLETPIIEKFGDNIKFTPTKSGKVVVRGICLNPGILLKRVEIEIG